MTTHENIRSTEDLLSVAAALERDSADRYRSLAAHLNAQGDSAIAAEFEALATIEDRHVEEVAARARALDARPGRPLPAGFRLPPACDEEEARGATLSAYQALAFAVRNEERTFAFYTYIAAATGTPALRALAEDLARDELDHASRLRRLRRRAFHQAPPVGVEIPANLERLRALARQWERAAARAHAGLADRLQSSGRSKDADVFRRLAREEEAAAADTPIAEGPTLANAAQGLRLIEETFDRLAAIGERAKDEAVVAEAQRMAQGVVARLALAREALDADRVSS